MTDEDLIDYTAALLYAHNTQNQPSVDNVIHAARAYSDAEILAEVKRTRAIDRAIAESAKGNHARKNK